MNNRELNRKPDRPPKIVRFAIETYGVRVGFYFADPDLIEEFKAQLDFYLPDPKRREIDYSRAQCRFGIGRNRRFDYVFYRGRRKVSEADNRDGMVKFFLSLVRVWIVERARGLVFVHAGVVAWKGAAIVIPARSFAGKTTLVAELVKLGAEYYSDEYAVIDAGGMVHPFVKPLSMREPGGDRTQSDVPVEYFGGRTGREPVTIGLVLLTAFSAGAEWEPEPITPGMAVLDILPHAISTLR